MFVFRMTCSQMSNLAGNVVSSRSGHPDLYCPFPLENIITAPNQQPFSVHLFVILNCYRGLTLFACACVLATLFAPYLPLILFCLYTGDVLPLEILYQGDLCRVPLHANAENGQETSHLRCRIAALTGDNDKGRGCY